MRTADQLQAILASEIEWLESVQEVSTNDVVDQMTIAFCLRRVQYAAKNLARQTSIESQTPNTPDAG